MDIIELRADLHKLLDGIQDEQLLRVVYDFLNQGAQAQDGRIWSELTEDQKREVYASYEESKDEDVLRKWEDVKRKY